MLGTVEYAASVTSLPASWQVLSPPGCPKPRLATLSGPRAAASLGRRGDDPHPRASVASVSRLISPDDGTGESGHGRLE